MLQSLHQILLSIIPVAFVIFLGWLAGFKKIVDNKHSHSLATYVMSFSFPCGLFVLTATSKPEDLLNGSFVIAFWLGLMGMYLISFLIYRFILRYQNSTSAQGAFVCSFPDMAFMGIPIFTSLLGKQALLSIAIGNICTSLIMIPIVTILLSGKDNHQTSIAMIIIKVLKKTAGFCTDSRNDLFTMWFTFTGNCQRLSGLNRINHFRCFIICAGFNHVKLCH